MGFVVPLKRWFREELRDYLEQVLLDSKTLGRGYFRPEVVKELVRPASHGRTGPQLPLMDLALFRALASAMGRQFPATSHIGMTTLALT